MDKRIIGIVFGGRSGEYEVSLLSAASVIRAIDKTKFDLVYIGISKEGEWYLVPKVYAQNKDGVREITADIIENGNWMKAAAKIIPGDIKELIDFALPVMHGPYCEDGKIQGFFEMLDIPYGGCGVLASALAMDKLAAKDVFIQHGIPVGAFEGVTRSQMDEEKEGTLDRVEKSLGYPCFVKPANMGSSVGISKAADREGLEEAIRLALKYDRRIIVEQYINCRELETAIMGNERPEAASVGEILPSAEFYDYKAKYFSSGASKICIPADISPEVREEIRSLAVRAYKAVDGEGFARVDFFIDKDTGKLYLNEINTIPGFTKYSMFPLLWEDAGVSYAETIERIIELGYERYNIKNSR
ncbi:MAG: D-alanine--D-alanine ligase [Firmicutes bacterium]|nr:D-alanine--D-alanine ligase [Bacillota bacterium]